MKCLTRIYGYIFATYFRLSARHAEAPIKVSNNTKHTIRFNRSICKRGNTDFDCHGKEV